MPPHLRNGRPAQQRRFVPATMVDCNCSECVQHQYFDQPSNQVLHGQRITMQQHKIHRQRDERRLLALANYNAVSSDPQGRTTTTTNSPTNGQAFDRERQSEPQPSLVTEKVPRAVFKRLQRLVKTPSPSNKTLLRLQISRQLNQSAELLNVVESDTFKQELERNPLVFARPPGKLSSIPTEDDGLEHLELDALASSNYSFIQHENALDGALKFFDSHGSGNMSTKQAFRLRQLKPRLKEEQRNTLRVKSQSWEQQWRIAQAEKERTIDTSPYHRSLRGMEPISCLVYLLTATLYFLANLSLEDLRFLLPCLSLLLKLALRESPNLDHISITTSIPSDLRTVISSLPIEPKFNVVVCCPTCFATYAFDADDPSSYPEFCKYQDISGGKVCGRRLQKKVEPDLTLPARLFTYQQLRHWIARMYSRPDIEQHLDHQTLEKILKASNEMGDIWDASILREFLGPDGRHFMDKPDAEGRLIFGLNMDGFNPYGNKKGGKHVSICGIYLVCFNLPVEIRYQAENVFLLGVVPGPTEPATHQVNHVLRPLVDDLLSLWSTGMFLTKTTKYPLGRPVRCALVPVICDLPAARRVAGLGGHSSGPFCSECLLHLSEINQLDRSKWTPRCYNDHCLHAQRWRDAKSNAERTRIFRAYGAKWSELLRLPYWDPTKFVVIDSMHGFYLRIFFRHIRDVWGMDIAVDDGNGMPDLNLSEEALSEARHVLRFGTLEALKELKKTPLQQLCREAGLHYGGQQGTLIKLLVQYRITQGWFLKDGTLIPEVPIVVPAAERTSDKSTVHNPPETSAASPSPLNDSPLPAFEVANTVTPSTLSNPSLPRVPESTSYKGTVHNSPEMSAALPSPLNDSPLPAFKVANTVTPSTSSNPSLARVPESTLYKSTVHDPPETSYSSGPLNDSPLPAFKVANTVTPSPLSNPSLPRVPIESTMLKEDLEELYNGARSRIDRANKETLVALCCLKLTGSREEYLAMGNQTLAQLLHTSRDKAGIIPVRRSRRAPDPKATSSPVINQRQPTSSSPVINQQQHTPSFVIGQQQPTASIPLIDRQQPTSPRPSDNHNQTSASATEAVAIAGPTDGLPIPGLTPDISNDTVTKLDKLYRTGAKSVIRGTRKYLLAVLCTMKLQGSVCDYEDLRKDQLLDILQESRVAEGIVDEDGSLLDKKAQQNFVVLGKETLYAIREDMSNISLPSWFTPAPKHPGDIKWGKFKADEWKAFCTVNLPVTLTRLWGSSPKTSRQYQMLENFMHVVTAVKIANMRRITIDDINLYEKHMELYVRGFIELYPFISISPYQHLALHFPSHLRRFGPTHSWRCFAFERYNGLIQGLPSNNKLGEMEKSKFIRFCRAQNLQALYSTANLPPDLHPIISMFENRYKINIRGTHNEETGLHVKQKTGKTAASLDQTSIKIFQRWMTQDEPSAPPIVIPSKCSVLSYVEHFGQRFDATGKGNSNVLFRRGSEAGLTAGRIVLVFSYTRSKDGKNTTDVFAILQEHDPLSEEDSRLDFYRQLPAAAGYLVHAVLKDSREVVRISDIVTHFASFPVYVPGIDGRCLQILPLRL